MRNLRHRPTITLLLMALLLLLLGGCEAEQNAAVTTLQNFAQPGLLQGNRVAPAPDGQTLWIADGTDTLTRHQRSSTDTASLDGADTASTASLTLSLPAEEGEAQWVSLFWQGETLLLRNFVDGKVWRYDPDAGSLTALDATIQSRWFFVVGSHIYFARQQDDGVIYKMDSSEELATLTDQAPERIQDLWPTAEALYFTHRTTGQLYRVNYLTGEAEAVTDAAVSAPVVDGETVYGVQAEAPVTLLNGDPLPDEVQQLYTAWGGTVYYATAEAGLVRHDGTTRTELERGTVLTVEVGDGWLFYQTADGEDHLIWN